MNTTTAVIFGICTFGFVSSAIAETQPHMAAALKHLESAQDQLRKADNDKGSHRERALDLIRSAMEEVRQGIEFDNRHNEDRGQRNDRQYEDSQYGDERGRRDGNRHRRGDY